VITPSAKKAQSAIPASRQLHPELFFVFFFFATAAATACTSPIADKSYLGFEYHAGAIAHL
jgi:hypothetical protein